MGILKFFLPVLIAAFAVASCSHASSASKPDRRPVDAAIEEAVSRGAFPFLYVRVENFDGDLVYEYSAIHPEFTTRRPTGDSWMRLWSMSKTVTIATILSLEEQGILNRSDHVTDYIPEFSELVVLSAESDASSCDSDLRAPKRAITIEDLLNHNDGFYYPFTAYDCLNDAMKQARLPESSSTEELINRIAQLPLHPDGVGVHQYGLGTTILGLVAERATGRSFDEVVKEHITGPLGIAQTLTYELPKHVPIYPSITGAGGKLRMAGENELDIFGGPVPRYGPDTNIYLGGEGMVGTT